MTVVIKQASVVSPDKQIYIESFLY